MFCDAEEHRGGELECAWKLADELEEAEKGERAGVGIGEEKGEEEGEE